MARRSAAAATSSPTVGEAAALERAAAQLRADAAALEAELAEKREQEEAKWFDRFDLDGSNTVDVHELRKGLEEVLKRPLDESMALRVLKAHDKNEDGLLQREEFRLSGLTATLEKLISDDEDAELEKRRLERQEAEEARLQAEAEASLPPANEDTGVFARLSSVIVYGLPILDSAKYGVHLAVAVPALQQAMVMLLSPFQLLDSVPYSQLIIFIIIQSLAEDRRLPILTRFNMRQAIVIDIALGLLQLLEVGAKQLGLTQVIPDPVRQLDFDSAVFVVVLLCITYAAGSSLLGVAPKGIPAISEYAERNMAPTRPSVKEAPEGEDKHK